MSDEITVGTPQDDAEVGALAAILGQVFSVPDGAVGTRKWLDGAGLANVRVVRRGTVVAGGLLVIPMGQWFGGRSVPTAGIAGVGVAPEQRARGAATTLMRETLREMREGGTAVSTLYPATQVLYRRVGYERAGTWTRVAVPTGAIDVRERGDGVRRATADDHAATQACYLERAQGSNGMLDRGDYVWRRVRGTDEKTHGYVVEEAGRVTGYTYFRHETTPDSVPTLACTDLVAATAHAARRLLGLFADHRSLSKDVVWTASPADPFLHHLAEQRDVVQRKHWVWMVRLLDVAAAFAARGWPAGLAAELHLDVADDLFAENAGRWTVRVEGGRAEAVRGGTGAVRVDVRGLAALWAGGVSASDAAACGALAGAADDVAAAAAVLSLGSPPWMADHF